jgi:hypothetical protein
MNMAYVCLPAGYSGVLERVTPEAPNDQGLTNSCLNVSTHKPVLLPLLLLN